MKIHMRFDSSNASHTELTLFMNGANVGKLKMTTPEALHLHDLFAYNIRTSLVPYEFVSSGEFYEGDLV